MKSRTTLSAERGAAALIVTMLLFFGMLLAAVFVNRNLVFEQRISANQYRSTQAFEAAEAGLEWALSQLNNTQTIGADCLASTAAGAPTFRERYLSFQKATSSFTPNTWASASVALPLQPTCVRGATGWSCSCPAQGHPVLSAPASAVPTPAFSLQFFAVPKAGMVRVVASGCSSLKGACLPGSGSGTADAGARTEVTFGLMPGLRTPPAATLTARGAVDVGSAAISVRNPDPSTGVTLNAGGAINAPQARIAAPAGTAADASLAANDTALADLGADALFATYFGIDKARWRDQPMVRRLACTADCASALQTALDTGGPTPMVWIDGSLTLAGPLALGSAARPVVIVASGAVQLRGDIVVHGLIYGAAASWTGTSAVGAPGGAVLHGALVSEAGYTGNGTPDLQYDADVLATLRTNSGSFARVSGSWRDF